MCTKNNKQSQNEIFCAVPDRNCHFVGGILKNGNTAPFGFIYNFAVVVF